MIIQRSITPVKLDQKIAVFLSDLTKKDIDQFILSHKKYRFS